MDIVIHILGICAMLFLFLIYQQKSRKNIILFKLLADVFWVAHYFLLGAVGGMIPNTVGIFREIVFYNRNTKKWARTPVWVAVFIIINFAWGLNTFSVWYNIIPIVASSFVTISLWINKPNLTKLITIPICISFLIYDIFVNSFMGMVNEIISLISIIIYFIRNKKEKNND
ncbi:MAG: YgjV family protein [Clostridia bacterium]|nr:YgjV family protein [Clostridia bacterium]